MAYYLTLNITQHVRPRRQFTFNGIHADISLKREMLLSHFCSLIRISCIGFEVLARVDINSIIFYDVTPCSLVQVGLRNYMILHE